ncbi:MAG: DUF58 domain-containing protein [Leptospirales bacterium]|jgi:uncharacterized protein (DUF58 family)
MNEPRQKESEAVAASGLWHTIVYYYPFTITGSVLFLISLYLVGYTFGTLNVFAAIFSTVSLLLLFVLVLDGRLQALRLQNPDVVWESSGPMVARLTDTKQRLHLGTSQPHWFYRFHFVIHGPFDAGREARFLLREEGASSRGSEIDIPLYFPVSGVARVVGRMYLKDVFGLTRARLGRDQQRTMHVQPPLLPGKPPLHFRNAASFESTRRMRNADEEKYYMREYQPGDRLKDLNWKASFRVGEMITRIAPKSPEESRLLHIELRNFSSAAQDSPAALLHLNFVKSWLLAFVSQVKREYPEFRFRIVTAQEVVLIESESDIHDFANRLAAMQYTRGAQMPQAATASEKFVFSTPYDKGLAAALQAGVIYNVFRTTNRASAAGGAAADEKKIRRVRFLPLEHRVPYPGLWLFRRDAKDHIAAGDASGSIVGRGGRLIEERLKVSLL